MERKTPLIEVTKSINYESSTFAEKSLKMVLAPPDAEAKPLIVHGSKFAGRKT